MKPTSCKEATGSSVGVFVSHVELNGEAQRKGLQVGDQLIQVNGLEVNSATYDEVIKLIRATPKRNDIVLMVSHVGRIPVQEKQGDPIKWIPIPIPISITHSTIPQPPPPPPPTNIAMSSVAIPPFNSNADYMQPIDCIQNLPVNHSGKQQLHNIQTNTSKTTKSFSSDEGVFCGSKSSLATGGHTNNNNNNNNSDNELADSIASSIDKQLTNVGRQKQLISPPVSLSSGCDISISTINSNDECGFNDNDANENDDDDNDDGGDDDEKEEEEDSESLNDTLIIVPGGQRTSETFGCGVVKGPDEWPGIFVQNVKPNSLAERVGLKPGDQLVQADGYLLNEMSFEEAIGLIKRLQLEQDELMLHVKMGAALRHLAASNRLVSSACQHAMRGNLSSDSQQVEVATDCQLRSQWGEKNCIDSKERSENSNSNSGSVETNNNHLIVSSTKRTTHSNQEAAKRVTNGDQESKELELELVRQVSSKQQVHSRGETQAAAQRARKEAKCAINGPKSMETTTIAAVAASCRKTTAPTKTNATATTGGNKASCCNSISVSQMAKSAGTHCEEVASKNKANGTSVASESVENNKWLSRTRDSFSSFLSDTIETPAATKTTASSALTTTTTTTVTTPKKKSNGDSSVAKQIKLNVPSASTPTAVTAKLSEEGKPENNATSGAGKQLVERKARASGGEDAKATKTIAAPMEVCKCRRLHFGGGGDNDDGNRDEEKLKSSCRVDHQEQPSHTSNQQVATTSTLSTSSPSGNRIDSRARLQQSNKLMVKNSNQNSNQNYLQKSPDNQSSYTGNLPAEDYEIDDDLDAVVIEDDMMNRNNGQDKEEEEEEEQREEIKIVSQNCKLHHHHLAQSFKTSQFVSEKFPAVNSSNSSSSTTKQQQQQQQQVASNLTRRSQLQVASTAGQRTPASGLRRRGQAVVNHEASCRLGSPGNATRSNRLQRYMSLENLNPSSRVQASLVQYNDEFECAADYARPTVDYIDNRGEANTNSANLRCQLPLPTSRLLTKQTKFYSRSNSVLGQPEVHRQTHTTTCCLLQSRIQARNMIKSTQRNAKTLNNTNMQNRNFQCCAYDYQQQHQQENYVQNFATTSNGPPLATGSHLLANATGSRACTPMHLASRLTKAKSMDKLNMSITNLNYITNIGLQHQRQLASALATPRLPISSTTSNKLYRQQPAVGFSQRQHKALRCATNTCCIGQQLMSGTGELIHESRAAQLYQQEQLSLGHQQQPRVTPRNSRATTCCSAARSVAQKTRKSLVGGRSTPNKQQQQRQMNNQFTRNHNFGQLDNEESGCCGGGGSLIQAKNHYLSSIELSQFDPQQQQQQYQQHRGYLLAPTDPSSAQNGKQSVTTTSTIPTSQSPDCLCCSPKFLAATCCNPVSPNNIISTARHLKQTGEILMTTKQQQQQQQLASQSHRSRRFMVNPTDCGATTDSSGYQSASASGIGVLSSSNDNPDQRRRNVGQDPRLLRVCPIDTLHFSSSGGAGRHAHLPMSSPASASQVCIGQIRETGQRMSTFLAGKSANLIQQQQQQQHLHRRNANGSLASDISPTCSSSASYSSPPLDSSLLSTTSDCSIETSMDSATQQQQHALMSSCFATSCVTKPVAKVATKMVKRSAQVSISNKLATAAGSSATTEPPAPPPLPLPDADFDNKINIILGKSGNGKVSAKPSSCELVVAAARRKQEAHQAQKQQPQQAKPNNRLCFVDELKLMARQSQQQQQKAPKSAPLSAGGNLAPTQVDGNNNNGIANGHGKQQSDSATLIKIINASKLAASKADGANGERASGCCSCNSDSTKLASSSSAGSCGNEKDDKGVNCANCCQQQQQVVARRKSGESGEKIASTSKQRGNKLKDEHDNKRRQHDDDNDDLDENHSAKASEMLMKEFKSAHSRMFGKRKESANQNAMVTNDHDHQQGATAAANASDDENDDYDDEGDESSSSSSKYNGVNCERNGIDYKQQQVDVSLGIARKSNPGLGCTQSVSTPLTAAN